MAPIGLAGRGAQAMGRGEGGLNTKLAAVVDARGRGLAVALAPGQQSYQKAVLPLLPARRSGRIVGGKGFATGAFCQRLQHQGLRACLPPKAGARLTAPLHRGYYRLRH